MLVNDEIEDQEATNNLLNSQYDILLLFLLFKIAITPAK
jgi:hypothetical protein